MPCYLAHAKLYATEIRNIKSTSLQLEEIFRSRNEGWLKQDIKEEFQLDMEKEKMKRYLHRYIAYS